MNMSAKTSIKKYIYSFLQRKERGSQYTNPQSDSVQTFFFKGMLWKYKIITMYTGKTSCNVLYLVPNREAAKKLSS